MLTKSKVLKSVVKFTNDIIAIDYSNKTLGTVVIEGDNNIYWVCDKPEADFLIGSGYKVIHVGDIKKHISEKKLKAVQDRFEKLFYGNGGHWLRLNMKCGDSLYIRRLAVAPYEKLNWEEFSVTLEGSEDFKDKNYKYDELIKLLATWKNK